eukprot:6132941-Pyramimonas_sp.AAC.1
MNVVWFGEGVRQGCLDFGAPVWRKIDGQHAQCVALPAYGGSMAHPGTRSVESMRSYSCDKMMATPPAHPTPGLG